MPYLDYMGTFSPQFLTNFMVEYGNGLMIADIMSPVVVVGKPSGKFYKMHKNNMKIYDLTREAGTVSKELSDSFTEDTYYCKQRRDNAVIPVEVLKNADAQINPRFRAAKLLKDSILLARENNVATLYRTSGGFGTTTLIANQKWDQYTATTSNPLEDIVNEINTIQGLLGEEPNILEIPFHVAQILSNHPDFTEQVKYTSDRFLTVSGIPQYIKGLKVVTPGVLKDTAPVGGTVTLAKVWGSDVIIARIDPDPGTNGLNPSTTFAEYTDKVRTWIDEPKEAEILEYGHCVDEKVIDTDCARVIQSVLT